MTYNKDTVYVSRGTLSNYKNNTICIKNMLTLYSGGCILYIVNEERGMKDEVLGDSNTLRILESEIKKGIKNEKKKIKKMG